MDVLIKHHIIKIYNNIKKKDTSGRKLKFSIDSYLDSIHYILKTGISWRSLCIIRKTPYNHTTLFKFYQKLCSFDVFNIVYNRLLKKYRTAKLKKININEYENLFIDSTMIKNINGRDVLGMNHYDRYRQASKLNVIIDSNKIPISHILVGANINDAILTLSTVDNIQQFHKNLI
jgi:hypothetical protein